MLFGSYIISRQIRTIRSLSEQGRGRTPQDQGKQPNIGVIRCGHRGESGKHCGFRHRVRRCRAWASWNDAFWRIDDEYIPSILVRVLGISAGVFAVGTLPLATSSYVEVQFFPA